MEAFRKLSKLIGEPLARFVEEAARFTEEEELEARLAYPRTRFPRGQKDRFPGRLPNRQAKGRKSVSGC